MNDIKDRLRADLERFTLSQEKKRDIAQLAKEKANVRSRSNWTYRVVLVLATILALSFSYNLIKRPMENGELSTGATDQVIDAALLGKPLIPYVLFMIIYIIVFLIINDRYQKKGKELPKCVHCHEQWTFKESLKRSFKGNEVTCPSCEGKQYKTRKSVRQLNYYTLAIPFGILLAQAPWGVNAFLAYLIFVFFVLLLMVYFAPYTIRLQKDDPLLKPWY